MRRIGIQYSKPGMVLSQDVFDSYGNMVMNQGTRLTFDNSSTLSRMGSGEIFIQDRRVDDVPVTSIMPARLEGEATRQLRAFLDETKDVVNNVLRGKMTAVMNVEKVMYSMISHLFPAYFGEVNASGCYSLKDYNYVHPVQVASLSIVIGRKLGLKEEALQKIGVAALVENVGYVALAPGMMDEPSSFTAIELHEVKQHPQYGFQILRDYTNLTPEVVETVRIYTRKLALGLGVVGLVNLQMAVKDNVVYILEANPRASRTVPFVSKATGIPIAKIAAKVMVGRKLKDLGYKEREIKHVAVKEVLLPFNKLAGVDTMLGPEMKSTGEVMGIDYDFGLAFYKACISADNELPLKGNIFISVNMEQKDEVIPIARKLRDLGLVLYGTEGTVDYLYEAGIEAHLVRKVQEGSPNVLDMMRHGEIRLIINTPQDRKSREDHYQIMRAAVDFQIPYITTLQAARAAALAIDAVKREKITLEPISHYLK